MTNTNGWPVIGGRGIISQYFSSWHHPAVDIADMSGPGLVAILPGRVITAGWEQGGCGNAVRIQHDNGYVTTYCHTGFNYVVSVGQRVNTGQLVAYMACSGTCTGPHVHFMLQLTPGGGYVNPLNYISR
jgi:murein DD-endopeptidase MepM/ murein hydrolase activator NlpD